MMRAADASAQLMDLGETEAVRAVDDDGIRRGYIEAAFDDGRAHQHIEAAMIKIEHELFQLPFPHLAVADRDDWPRAPVSRMACAVFSMVSTVL